LKDIFEIVLIKIKRWDYVYDNKEGIFYDEDGVPLNKDWQIELTQINYKDLPENAKKKFDAMEKWELTFVDY
jgi:hypothetical protein